MFIGLYALRFRASYTGYSGGTDLDFTVNIIADPCNTAAIVHAPGSNPDLGTHPVGPYTKVIQLSGLLVSDPAGCVIIFGVSMQGSMPLSPPFTFDALNDQLTIADAAITDVGTYGLVIFTSISNNPISFVWGPTIKIIPDPCDGNIIDISGLTLDSTYTIGDAELIQQI